MNNQDIYVKVVALLLLLAMVLRFFTMAIAALAS